MTLSRRTFLAALAGLPVLGKLVAKPTDAPLTMPGGENFVGYSVDYDADYPLTEPDGFTLARNWNDAATLAPGGFDPPRTYRVPVEFATGDTYYVTYTR